MQWNGVPLRDCQPSNKVTSQLKFILYSVKAWDNFCFSGEAEQETANNKADKEAHRALCKKKAAQKAN